LISLDEQEHPPCGESMSRECLSSSYYSSNRDIPTGPHTTQTQRYTHIQNTTSHSTETYIETYPLTATNFYSVETYPHTAQRYRGAYRELKKYTGI